MPQLSVHARVRVLVFLSVGLALLSICYLALGHAQARADGVDDSRCVERTVDGGLFENEHRGVPALVCATEYPIGASRVQLDSRSATAPH